MKRFESMTSKGFTIIELIVVIVAIGILVTVAIVGYGSWQKSILETQVKNDLSAAASAMENARNFNNRYPEAIPSTVASSDGESFNGGGSPDGQSFCIDKASASDPSIQYYIMSTNVSAGPQPGSCNGTAFAGVVTTFAGSSSGYADGTGTSAQFYYPTGMAFDSQGNLFVCDALNHRIRKITPQGVVTTFAGSSGGFADGTGTAAQFNAPVGVAIDSHDNLFIADQANHRIRKITPQGVVTTFAGTSQGNADGTGTAAQFQAPSGIAIDSNDNLYVTGAHRIRKITPSAVVTTLAGSSSGYVDGTGASAKFYTPYGLTVDAAGVIYVADYNNHRIRKVTQAGVVTTIAGSSAGYADGTGTSAQFNFPNGIVIDPSGTLFVVELANHKLRKISPAGIVTTVAGSTVGSVDGTGTGAQFNYPFGIARDASGTLYISDYMAHRIRKVQ